VTNYSTHTDKALFKEMALGNEPAFGAVFHRYIPLLLPFAIKLVGATKEPEEVIQEVFLKVWMHREKLAAVDNPKAYLVRIVSNEATNYLQKLARQNRLMEKAMQNRGAEPLTPEENLALKETAGLVTEAIEHLTPTCRQVYLLSREEYLSIPEIATRLHLSESTVKNQLVKALKDIRQYIRKTGLSTFLTFPIIF
jgi:RNA polymerase sigma-70 factor (family 1)